MTTALAQRNIRLGHNLTGVDNMETALERAGLNWGLRVLDAGQPISLFDSNTGEVIVTTIPDHRLVLRDDNQVTLGVVKGKYQEVDNRSVFHDLGQSLLNQGAKLNAGGEFDHGRKTWLLFDLPGTNVELLNGQDLVKWQAAIRTTHDGSGNITAELRGTRLVCTNGMTSTIKGVPHTFSIRHTASAETRMKEAETVMAGANRYAKAFASAAQHMLDTPMTRAQFIEFIEGMFPKPVVKDGESTRGLTLWETRQRELLALFSFAETNHLGRGSRWAAFNSVTEYLDWNATVRGGTDLAATRARRQFDGTNQPVRDRAFAELVSTN